MVEEIVPTFHPAGKKVVGMGRQEDLDEMMGAEMAAKEAAAAVVAGPDVGLARAASE